MKNRTRVGVLVITSLFLGACQVAEPVAAPPRPHPDGPVSVQNGMLVFGSMEDFTEIGARLQDLPRDEADSWELSLGFTSQRNIFDRIVDAEYAYLLAPYEHMSEEELGKINPPLGHSAAYDRYLAEGLIHELPEADGGSYDYNLLIPSLARVVNEEGFFAIEETIFQVNGGSMKELRDGTFAQLDELSRATVTDESANIYVHTPPPGALRIQGDFDKSTGWQEIGKRRGSLRVIFNRSFINPYPYSGAITKYEVNVQSQRKNFWGNWVYADCPNEVWISGTWKSSFDYISSQNLSYAGTDSFNCSYSYPHPNCINNFKGTFSPGPSCASLPYPSSTQYTAPSGKAFTQVSITPMAWNAAVPGGNSGIQLGVSN